MFQRRKVLSLVSLDSAPPYSSILSSSSTCYGFLDSRSLLGLPYFAFCPLTLHDRGMVLVFPIFMGTPEFTSLSLYEANSDNGTVTFTSTVPQSQGRPVLVYGNRLADKNLLHQTARTRPVGYVSMCVRVVYVCQQ